MGWAGHIMKAQVSGLDTPGGVAACRCCECSLAMLNARFYRLFRGLKLAAIVSRNAPTRATLQRSLHQPM